MVALLWILGLLGVTNAGLLRVPKVYNAVITSNQNLSPSRAFPVIQPVIHRTAIGYVPPLYYTQVVPSNAGSEIVRYPETPLESEGEKSPNSRLDQEPKEARKVEARTKDETRNRVESTTVHTDVVDNSAEKPDGRMKNDDQLSFYPNYQAYYEPYIYTYNGYSAHLVGTDGAVGAGNYYVDYQPYSAITPIGPSLGATKKSPASHLLPAYHHQIQSDTEAKKGKDKVPDVPAPPIPTSGPKQSATTEWQV